MTWVRLDDNFHAHPKALEVGLAGSGLYARALSYCADYETDGYVPAAWVALQTREQSDLGTQLEHAGLWQASNGGYRITDFLDYNPSKKQLEEQRKHDREKKEKQRKAAAGNG